MDTEVFTPFKYAKNRGKNLENGIASLNEVDVQTAWKWVGAVYVNVAGEPYLLFPSRPTRFKYTVPKKG